MVPGDACGSLGAVSTDELTAPRHPRAPSWLGVLRRTVSQARTDDVGDWAAALTY